MKVGDTLTATVVDRNGEDVSDAVSYQWYADDVAIEGATDETLDVTVAMIGSTIKVVATAESGNTFESEATEEVALYEALTLISAEQTAADQVTLTTSDEIDADDKIEVKRGKKEVKVTDTDYTDDGAVITLADKIVSGAEYTVTLTPADGSDATSATFTGEKAEVGRIEFINKVLVMKDSKYSEGYAYVKGYDQYNKPISLTGLTVTPGVGQFKSFDATTGKITISSGVAANETSPFMTIKEVPVFVQYQNGTTILSQQETLTVSTMGYLASMEFGEIGKDGTMRDDERLTVTELASKKYYVEILDAEDQYGNPLTADDLNDQREGGADGTQKTLFVIPGETGPFYTTGRFAELKGKTILWLEDGDGKPGSMTLTITGAGGAYFTKDIEIEKDPFIQTLNVTYPQLNVNVAESDEFEWSAIDQYNDVVDMYDFKPHIEAGNLVFSDTDPMTNRHTTITLSGNAAFNDVTYDAGARTFKVTVTTQQRVANLPNFPANTAARKGDMVSYVVTTAGMAVGTHQTTIGGEGTAARIKTDGTSQQLVAKDTTSGKKLGGSDTYDFNNKITFEDANGQIMKRSDADWPEYSDVNDITYTIDDDNDPATPAVPRLLMTAPNNDWKATNYYWTLAKSKVTNGVITQAGNGGKFDVDTMKDPATGAKIATADVYVVLWGEDNSNNAVLLDQKPFHFTQVVGTEKKFTAACSDTLYVQKPDDGYTDNVTVKVTATTDKGETYEVDADRIRLGAKIPFTTDKNVVYGYYPLDTKGSTTATVFVDTDVTAGENWEEETSVTINYTNEKPVPSKVDYAFKSVPAGSRSQSTFGQTGIGVDAPTEFETATAGVTADIDTTGTLTIINANSFGDKLTACIKDQYGQVVPNTVFKTNGNVIINGSKLTAGKNVVEYSSGAVNGRFVLYNKTAGDITVNVAQTEKTTAVKTAKQLEEALEAAIGSTDKNIITIDATTINYDKDLYVDESVELVIPENKTLNVTGSVTNKGLIRGDKDAAGDVVPAKTGHLTINGNPIPDGAILDGGGVVNLPGNSLQLQGVTVTGSPIIKGKILIAGNVVFGKDSDVQIVTGSTIDFATDSKLTVEKAITIVKGLDDTEAAPAGNLEVKVDGTAATGANDIITALQKDSEVVAIPEDGDPITCTPAAYEILPDLVALDKGIDELDEETYGFTDLSGLADEYKAAIDALAKVPSEDVEPGHDTMNDLVKLAIDQNLFGMVDGKNYDDLKKAIKGSVPGRADDLLDDATDALNGAVTTYLNDTTGGTDALEGLLTQYSDYPTDYEALLTALEVEHTEPTTKEAEFTTAFEGASEVVELAAITTPSFTVAQDKASATATVALEDGSELSVDIGASLNAKVNVNKSETDGTLTVTPNDNAQTGDTTNLTITISGEHYKRFINYEATIDGSDRTKLASVAADSTGRISKNQS